VISHEHRCIFIHIPKCAGTSIEKALGHFTDYHGWSRQDHRTIRMVEPISLHSLTSKENIKEVVKRFLIKVKRPSNPRNSYTVNNKEYANYFKFTMIRNPWARAYSWYKNVLREEVFIQQYNISNEISLYDFLRLNIGKDALRPQTFWLKNFNGQISIDYIGRFENLSDDFERACRIMQITPVPLPYEVKGDSVSYRDVYDDRSVDLVKKFYQEEIAIFDYSF
jgi:hypothetical protein